MVDNISYEVFDKLTYQSDFYLSLKNAEKIEAKLKMDRKLAMMEIVTDAFIVAVYLLKNKKVTYEKLKDVIISAMCDLKIWKNTLFEDNETEIKLAIGGKLYTISAEGNNFHNEIGKTTDTQKKVLVDNQFEINIDKKTTQHELVSAIQYQEIKKEFRNLLLDMYAFNAPISSSESEDYDSEVNVEITKLERRIKEIIEETAKLSIDYNTDVEMAKLDPICKHDTGIAFERIKKPMFILEQKITTTRSNILYYHYIARVDIMQLPADIDENTIAVISGSIYHVPKLRDTNGNNWMHWAVAKRNVDMMERLLSANVSLHHPNSFGITPLQMILMLGIHSQMFQVLQRNFSSRTITNSPTLNLRQMARKFGKYFHGANIFEDYKFMISDGGKHINEGIPFELLVSSSNYQELQQKICIGSDWSRDFAEGIINPQRKNLLSIAITSVNAAFNNEIESQVNLINAFHTLKICLRTVFNRKVLQKLSKKIDFPKVYVENALNHVAVKLMLESTSLMMKIYQNALDLNLKETEKALQFFKKHKQEVIEKLESSSLPFSLTVNAFLLQWFRAQNVFAINAEGETIFHALLAAGNSNKDDKDIWDIIICLADNKISSLAMLPGANEDSTLIQVAIANGFTNIVANLASNVHDDIFVPITDIKSVSIGEQQTIQRTLNKDHALTIGFIGRSVGFSNLGIERRAMLLQICFNNGMYNICRQLIQEDLSLIFVKTPSKLNSAHINWLDLFLHNYQQQDDNMQQLVSVVNYAITATIAKWMQSGEEDIELFKLLGKYGRYCHNSFGISLDFSQYYFSADRLRDLFENLIRFDINVVSVNIEWAVNFSSENKDIFILINSYITKCNCLQQLNLTGTGINAKQLQLLFADFDYNTSLKYLWLGDNQIDDFSGIKNSKAGFTFISVYGNQGADIAAQMKVEKDINSSDFQCASLFLQPSYYLLLLPALERMVALTLLLPKAAANCDNVQRYPTAVVQKLGEIRKEIVNLLYKVGKIGAGNNLLQQQELLLQIHKFNANLQQLVNDNKSRMPLFNNQVAWALAKIGLQLEATLYNADFENRVIKQEGLLAAKTNSHDEQQQSKIDEDNGDNILWFGQIFAATTEALLKECDVFIVKNDTKTTILTAFVGSKSSVNISQMSDLQQRFYNIPLPELKDMPPEVQRFMRSRNLLQTINHNGKASDLKNLAEIGVKRSKFLTEGIFGMKYQKIYKVLGKGLSSEMIELTTYILQFMLAQQLLILQPEAKKLDSPKPQNFLLFNSTAISSNKLLIDSLVLHFCLFWCMVDMDKVKKMQNPNNELLELMVLWLRYVPISSAMATQSAMDKNLPTLYGSCLSVADVAQGSGLYGVVEVDSGIEKASMLVVNDLATTDSFVIGAAPLTNGITQMGLLQQANPLSSTEEVFTVMVKHLGKEEQPFSQKYIEESSLLEEKFSSMKTEIVNQIFAMNGVNPSLFSAYVNNSSPSNSAAPSTSPTKTNLHHRNGSK